MAVKKIVGNPTPRVEGVEKVTGRAVYALDVTLPGMLWGKVLRCPIPYGHIKRIDAGKAVELPGVKAVVTGKDVAGWLIGRRIYDMPILAQDVVRFIGEKVAAVAAESEEIAERALDLIEVEYEEMEPLLDPEEALKPSAPILHTDVMDYKGLLHPIESPTNAFVQMSWKKEDIEEGFRMADLVVENTFETQVAHQAYIEPHSCVVTADASEGAEIWACSKVPFALRDQVATALQVPAQKIVVHPCYIGGDFGGKGDFMDVALCTVLSRKSGRPVKMVMTYDEEFIAGNPRHASIIKARTGVMRDGRLVALHLDFIFDSGAYGAFKPIGFLFGPMESGGPYNIPHVLLEEKIVYTNKIPCGHMRAPGETQANFAAEGQMDLVARRLDMDPVEFRRINLIHDGGESPTGEVIPYIKAEETLDRALQVSGYYKTKKKNVGRGVALAQWLPLGGESTVFVRIDEEGSVTLSSVVLDQGVGVYTLMRQIVAEELKVPLDSIRIETLDTTKVATDTGVGGSRSTRVYGNATYEAATKAKEEILKLAAGSLGAEEDQLVLADGAAVHKRREQGMSFADVVRVKGSPIDAQGYYNNTEMGPEASMCVQVAEVEVDPETGEIKLKQITTAHDTGTVINPLMHQGQIDGAVVMGLGYAMMEDLIIADGRVATVNFGDYKIPTIRDLPVLKTAITESPTGKGPYRSMSIGETPLIPLASAIGNAVGDALGKRINSLPISAEKVLAVLNRR